MIDIFVSVGCFVDKIVRISLCWKRNVSDLKSITKAAPRPKPWDSLNDLGVRILACLLEDPHASNNAIAKRLQVSHNTTKAHFDYIHQHLLQTRLRPSKAVLEELTIHFIEARLKERREAIYEQMAAFLNASDAVQQYYMLKADDLDYLIKVVTEDDAAFREFHLALQEQDFIENAHITHSVYRQLDTHHHELSFLIQRD